MGVFVSPLHPPGKRLLCVALTLHDISIAVDSINHSILVGRLSLLFSVSGVTLSWLKSYLSVRYQIGEYFCLQTVLVFTHLRIFQILRVPSSNLDTI